MLDKRSRKLLRYIDRRQRVSVDQLARKYRRDPGFELNALLSSHYIHAELNEDGVPVGYAITPEGRAYLQNDRFAHSAAIATLILSAIAAVAAAVSAVASIVSLL